MKFSSATLFVSIVAFGQRQTITTTNAANEIPEFCKALTATPVDGSSCEGVLPEGTVGIGMCGGEKTTLGANGLPDSVIQIPCTCDASSENPKWSCTEFVETRAPSPAGEGPGAEDYCDIPTPSTGDDCSRFLALQVTTVMCTFVQVVTGAGGVVTANDNLQCVCSASITPSDSAPGGTWTCDGAIPPAPSPVSLMPAGEGQPVQLVPVPTTAITTTSTMICPAEDSIPNDGDSCVGALGSTNTAGSCSWNQTVIVGNNESYSFSEKKCDCVRVEVEDGETWSCTGGIDPVPPAAAAGTADITKGVEDTLDMEELDLDGNATTTATSTESTESSSGSFVLSTAFVAVIVVGVCTATTVF